MITAGSWRAPLGAVAQDWDALQASELPAGFACGLWGQLENDIEPIDRVTKALFDAVEQRPVDRSRDFHR
jgi:hypothetical protein